jgi:pimeloyl-ACP methyl ester carboxylesterase
VGRLTVEAFYPARVGSELAVPAAVYDIREHLPASQRAKISDAKNPLQKCSCYRDLPLDEQHGPYPLVLFIHGTAGFRTQSLAQLTHLASRGFVVVAADHPGLMLADALSLVCPGQPAGKRDLAGDATAVLAAVQAGGEQLAFLTGHVDLARVGLVGHSAGGATVADIADRTGVQVVVPWAAGTAVKKGPDFRSALFIGGLTDKVVPFSAVKTGYNASPAPRRLVGIDKAGHLVMTELCSLKNAEGDNILQVAKQAGVCGAGLAGQLFDCSSGYLPDERGRDLVAHATTAVLEATLQCGGDAPGLLGLRARYPEVAELEEQLN